MTINQYIAQFIRFVGSKTDTKALHKSLLEKFVYKDGAYYIKFSDPVPPDQALPPITEYEIRPNTNEGTFDVGLPNGTVGQMFKELFIDGQNDTGSTILNGKAVAYASAIGNSGNIRIKLAKASSTEAPFMNIGITTHDILDGDVGNITTFGKVRGIQTNGANYGETWLSKDILYISGTTDGALTNIKPQAPTPAIPIAVVISAHATNGTILVRPSFPVSMTDLTDVNGTPLTESGQFPVYNNSTKVFDFTENINNYTKSSFLTDIFNATLDPTGFIDNNEIDVSYSIVNRKITLTRTGGIEYFWRGVKYTLTSPWTSDARTAGNGRFFLSFNNGSSFGWSNTVWAFSDIQAAIVLQGNTYHFATHEVHGLRAWQDHRDQHNIDGTLLVSGGGVTAGTYAENTATDAANSPGFNAATLRDEDIDLFIAAWIEGTYTTLYIGAANEPIFSTVDALPFRSAGSYLLVNNPTTGANTAGVTGKYYNVYQILIPVTSDSDSQKFRMVMLQPQATYDSLAAAQAENISGLSLGDLANLAPEFKFYTRITYVTSASDGNTGKCRIATGGISYITGSKNSPVSVSGILSSNHQALSNLDWLNSGHTGTANYTPVFSATGTPALSPVQLTAAGSVNIPTGQTYQVNGVQITSLALSDVFGMTNNYLPKKTATGFANSLLRDNGTTLAVGMEPNNSYILSLAAADKYFANINTGPLGAGSGGLIGNYAYLLPTAADQRLGIHVFGSTNSGTAFLNNAAIGAYSGAAWATNDYPTYLAFFTTASGASTRSERMRLTSAGNLIVGGTGIASARVHSVSTTEQLRLGYDSANYVPFTVNSTGDITVAPTGQDFNVTGRLSATISLSSATIKLTTGAVVGYYWKCNNIDGSGEWAALPSFSYPAAGIAVSTGSAWGTSITDNSTNWNTAYSERRQWDGGNTNLVAATGRTSLGATTIGSNLFTLTNPSAVTFPRFNADNTVSALSAADMKTAIGVVDSPWITAANGIYYNSGSVAINISPSTFYRLEILTGGRSGVRLNRASSDTGDYIVFQSNAVQIGWINSACKAWFTGGLAIGSSASTVITDTLIADFASLKIDGTERISSAGIFTPANGVSGTWTTVDGKTITATNGIITSIV